MNSSQAYPSKFLKSEDLDEDIVVTIEMVELEEVGTQREPEQKPVAHFKETDKGLILNKTNWKQIAKQFGDESDDWAGKQITLTVMDVEFQGDIVAAIRVKAPRVVKPAFAPKAAQTVKAVAPLATAAPATDDAVTEFWTAAKAKGYDRKSGVELLESFNGDFAKALEGLLSGNVPF